MAGFQVLSICRRKSLVLKAFLTQKLQQALASESWTAWFFLKRFHSEVISAPLLAKWFGCLQPCCLPEFISSWICLVASPSWSGSVHLSGAGADPEVLIHLGGIFSSDCQPESGPGGWWLKLKQTWAQSKPFGFDLEENFFVICAREMQFK